MQHEAKAIGTLAKGIVIRAIVNCECPTERKERIMLARECGLLDDDETASLISHYGLLAA